MKRLTLLACLLAAGCITRPTTPPVVVVGERIFKPAPDTELHIGPLIPPAKQWYIVDDVALQQWLGIQVPAGK